MSAALNRKHPALRLVRELVREPSARRDRGLVVLEGARLVDEWLAGGGRVSLALLTREAAEDAALAAQLDAAGAMAPDQRLVVSDQLMSWAADTRSPQGVLVVLPRAPAARIARAAGRPLVVGWELQDPGNVGALVRAAEGSGCAGAVFARSPGGASADPLSPRALRASAGSALRLPVVNWEGAPESLADELEGLGFSLAACLPRGGQAPDEAELAGAVALLLGSETRGLPEALTRRAMKLSVPLAGAVDSLGVAAAGALMAFEAARQRRLG